MHWQLRSQCTQVVINHLILPTQTDEAANLAEPWSFLRLAMDVGLQYFSLIWIPTILEYFDQLHIFLSLAYGILQAFLYILTEYVFV